MIGLRTFFAGLLLVSAAAAPSSAAAPGMAVNWVEVSGDQDDCVKQATNSLKRNNFGTRFEVINNRTLYGERGDYTAAVLQTPQDDAEFSFRVAVKVAEEISVPKENFLPTPMLTIDNVTKYPRPGF